MSLQKISILVILLFVSLTLPKQSSAEVLCQHQRDKGLRIFARSCPARYSQVLNTARFRGATGLQGLTGEQGETGSFHYRKYYLTPTTHLGDQALSACAAGYHMTSVSELGEATLLRYNTVLGLSLADSGEGAPTHIAGWARTGGIASVNEAFGNCSAWTSSSGAHQGRISSFENFKSGLDASGPGSCNVARPVWCIEDLP